MTEREEVEALVLDFFNGDETKLCLWLGTPNPLFGNISPAILIRLRPGKVLKFVRESLQQNEPPGGER